MKLESVHHQHPVHHLTSFLHSASQTQAGRGRLWSCKNLRVTCPVSASATLFPPLALLRVLRAGSWGLRVGIGLLVHMAPTAPLSLRPGHS